MDNEIFVKKCKQMIVDLYNKRKGSLHRGITVDQLFVVWLSKTLQNNKALLATKIEGDGLYFEITYNGDKQEFYIDVYKKQENIVVLIAGDVLQEENR